MQTVYVTPAEKTTIEALTLVPLGKVTLILDAMDVIFREDPTLAVRQEFAIAIRPQPIFIETDVTISDGLSRVTIGPPINKTLHAFLRDRADVRITPRPKVN